MTPASRVERFVSAVRDALRAGETNPEYVAEGILKGLTDDGLAVVDLRPGLTDAEIAELAHILALHMPYRRGLGSMLGDLSRSRTADRRPYVRDFFVRLLNAVAEGIDQHA